jgi:hypothetical protein
LTAEPSHCGQVADTILTAVIFMYSREFMSFGNAVQRAAGVASDTWKLLNDPFAEGGKPLGRYPSGQRFPF